MNSLPTSLSSISRLKCLFGLPRLVQTLPYAGLRESKSLLTPPLETTTHVTHVRLHLCSCLLEPSPGSRPATRSQPAISTTMSFLSSFATSVTKSASESYNQLRGPAGAPQSASETIDKLCDRLANATLVEDRRAALLGLKGLSRDWKAVSLVLPPLLLLYRTDGTCSCFNALREHYRLHARTCRQYNLNMRAVRMSDKPPFPSCL